MAAEDYIDYDLAYHQKADTLGVTCKYCGKDQFSWVMTRLATERLKG